MQFLYSIDKAIFYFINRALANSVLDAVMPFITVEENGLAFVALAWLALVLFGGKQGRITAVLIVVVLLFADQIVNFLIKPLVGRDRPCFVLDHVRLLIRQPHSHSFPSSHAANSAAVAGLIFTRHRKWGAVLLFLAFCIGLSRVYVGVHYPSDVAVGFAAGALVAWGVLRAWRTVELRPAGRRTAQTAPSDPMDERL